MPKKVKPEINEYEQKANEYLAGWQRAQADLVNMRNRHEEDRKSLLSYAHSDIVEQILPVFDNFMRAAEHTPTDESANWTNWANGIKAIEKQFETVLNQCGVNQIKVAIGDTFDPNFHEALMTEKSELEPDKILAIIEPGYMLNDKVLRPVKVKVSSGE
ncbi:MAG: nucleotide exchange factor GrpE [Patescibacteria group bacterium]|jgi:molecular chaperone GrpE